MAKPDDEKQLDSITHHEERQAKMREEYAHNQQEAQNRADQQAAHQQAQTDEREIKNYGGIIKDGETRDELLARIRRESDTTPPEVEPVGRVSEGMIKEYEAEQRLGREMVAREEERQRKAQEVRQRIETTVEGEKKGVDGPGASPKPRHG